LTKNDIENHQDYLIIWSVEFLSLEGVIPELTQLHEGKNTFSEMTQRFAKTFDEVKITGDTDYM